MSRIIDIWELLIGWVDRCLQILSLVLSTDSGVNGVDTQDIDPSHV